MKKRTLKILTISTLAIALLLLPFFGFASELIMKLDSSGYVTEVNSNQSDEAGGELVGEVSGNGGNNQDDLSGELSGSVPGGSGGGSGSLSGFVSSSNQSSLSGGGSGSISSFSLDNGQENSLSGTNENTLASSPFFSGGVGGFGNQNSSNSFGIPQNNDEVPNSPGEESLAFAPSDNFPSLQTDNDSLALGDNDSLLLAAAFSMLSLGTGNLLLALIVSLILVLSLGYYLFVIRT